MTMKNIKFFIWICLLLFSVNVMAQSQITISGTVTDEKKEPLIGVNVTVKNQAGLGSITDIDGKFTIKVDQYSTLLFSYIGFETQEHLIKNQRKLNVTMKESSAKMLDEVVITGTGAQKKLTVTGAITTVNLKEIESTGSTNITNTLAGNVPGILAMQTSGQPGKNTSEFWVRGMSTFGANNSALVLVDGFERALEEVNIEDIESFSVLKDASSTAIYGPRGANGVILITTKHGKMGKVNIQAKYQASYNSRTITPELVDGYTYASLANEARITRNEQPMYSPSELELIRTGLDPDLYPNVNWIDQILKGGAMTHRASLNLSGGGSTARYYVSLSYLNEEGMYKTDDVVRKDYNTNTNGQLWTYRLNTDIDVTKTTLLKVGVAGSLRKVSEPGMNSNIWNSALKYNPVICPVMYSNGYVPSYTDGSAEFQDKYLNPWVLATQTGYNETWQNKIQTNINLTQKLDFITPGLRFVGRFGFDTTNNNTISRLKFPEVWRAQRFRDDNGNIIFDRLAEERKMSQTSSATGNRYEFFEAEFNYNRNFKGNRVSGTLKYTQDKKVMTNNVGTDLKNGIAVSHMGIAGRIAYNYNYRYFADFNFGYNGSENFADGNRFGFFPAFSLAWNIAEEKWVKENLKFLNMFKVRYSWGKVGNANIGERFPYLYTIGTTYVQNNQTLNYPGYNWGAHGYSNLNYNGMRYTSLASENVTWEVSTKHDLGFDISLFNDKFTATFDLFHEQRDGIFQVRSYLPLSVGAMDMKPKSNIGSVLSRGFDGNFAFRQDIGKVKLTLRGNMTYSKNEILEYDEQYNVYDYLNKKGYQVGQLKGYVAEGLFKDWDDIRNSPKQNLGSYEPGDIKYKDVNGDGVINGSDQVAVGGTQRPSVVYGVGLSASWKGLDFNVHFQGAGKSSFFLTGESVFAFSSKEWGNVFKGITDDRWISSEISNDPATENPNATFPRLSYGGSANNFQPSTYWLRDASYLRLKTLEIGYSLPKTWVRKIKFNNVRIFFIGSNILTFSNFKLWDPELGIGHGNAYPLTKSFTLGLNVNI